MSYDCKYQVAYHRSQFWKIIYVPKGRAMLSFGPHWEVFLKYSCTGNLPPVWMESLKGRVQCQGIRLWGCHCPERLMSPWQWQFFSREVGAYTTMLALWIGPFCLWVFPFTFFTILCNSERRFPRYMCHIKLTATRIVSL